MQILRLYVEAQAEREGLPDPRKFKTHEDWAQYALSTGYKEAYELGRVNAPNMGRPFPLFSLQPSKQYFALRHKLLNPYGFIFNDHSTSDTVLRFVYPDSGETLIVHAHRMVLERVSFPLPKQQQRSVGYPGYGKEVIDFIIREEQARFLVPNCLYFMISVFYGADPTNYFNAANVSQCLPSMHEEAKSSIQRMYLVLTYLACANYVQSDRLLNLGLYAAIRELDAWNIELLYTFILEGKAEDWDNGGAKIFDLDTTEAQVDASIGNGQPTLKELEYAVRLFFRRHNTENASAAIGCPIAGSVPLGSWPHNTNVYGTLPAPVLTPIQRRKILWAHNLVTLQIATNMHPAYTPTAERLFTEHIAPTLLMSLPFGLTKNILLGLRLSNAAKLRLATRVHDWRLGVKIQELDRMESNSGRLGRWRCVKPTAQQKAAWAANGRRVGFGRLAWWEFPCLVRSVNAAGRTVEVFDYKRYCLLLVWTV